MENLLPYILKASALLAVFFLAYHTLLKKETFFKSNRLFLLSGLITSALLPLVQYTKVILVDPVQARPFTPQELAIINATMQQVQKTPGTSFEVSCLYILGGLYVLGLAFLVIRLLADVFKIRKMLAGNCITKLDKYKLVDSPNVDSPFSFFSYILYNSGALQPQELENILTHEKVHSRQKHSVDMLLAQVFCIAFWFNPIAWLYKKSISQNLEFIADAEASKQVADIRAYQKTMLRLSVQPQYISITNHFYQSLIKKRIVMLNKQKSRRCNSWKYVIVLPALTAFVLAFQVKVVAQEKELPVESKVSEKIKVAQEITKDSKDEELQSEKDIFKKQFDTDVTISNVARNNKKEITGIKVAIKAKDIDKVYEVSGTDPISPFTIEIEKEDSGKLKIAFGGPVHKQLVRQHAININTPVTVADTVITFAGNTAPIVPKNAVVAKAISHPTEINMDDKLLIIVNGKKIPKGESLKLPFGEEIAEMKVLKDREAKKKYGKEAKDGAVEITTNRSMAGSFAMPHGQSFVYHISDDMIAPGFENFALNPEDFKVFEDMDFMPDMDNLKEHFQVLKEMNSADIHSIMANREKIAAEAKAIARSARAEIEKDRSYRYEYFSDKMKDEMDKTRKEMEQARKDMEKIRKEMQAEREKYRAIKKTSQKA